MRKNRKRKNSRLASLGLILLSFAVIILVGTILLACPFSHKGDGLSFIDSLFVSTSAVCVTGLSPVADISASLNVFGRIVLAILIEIGGLGFVTILMFIAVIFGFKISFGQRMLLKEALNQDTIGGIVMLIKHIVLTAITIQFIGFALNFIDFFFIHEFSFVDAIGFALFHAISSFNNAGFDLFGSTSLVQFSDDILFNISTSLMIIMGGIGFVVIFDLLQKKRLRKLNMHSKIVLMMTTILLAFGTIAYKALNWDSITFLEAFFLSVSTRTAGFYSFDLGLLDNASVIITMILMFFGAAPVSTGGGVKVTTLFTLISSFVRFAKGSREAHAFKRKIPEQQETKAFVLTTFALSFVILTMIIISISERNNNVVTIKSLLFECVSAFGTVGLTLGITPLLNPFSKVILCIIMFVGRLGPITFISMFNRNANAINKDSIGYVEGNIIIG